MNNNLIDFSRFTPRETVKIDNEAAKKYFINEVLPYVSLNSLQRLIAANTSSNSPLVKLEMMRMFVESELMNPNTTDTSSLNLFFTQS